MRRAIVAVLAVVFMLPTGVTARSADDSSSLWALVPPGPAYRCQELGSDTFKRVVEPSIAALQCFYEGGPNKIDDIGLFLFDSRSELRAFWDARKEQRLGRATRGDCTKKDGAGVMDIPGGELMCYQGSGQARFRWIDEEDLLYGALDTRWAKIPWAYDWWLKNIGSAAEPEAVGDAVAAPSESEAAAIYRVRAELIEALRETKTEWARYKAYRDEPQWSIVDDGWGYVDVDRLADYVPIAQYVEDHPEAFEVLSGQPFWLDSSLVASVSLLIDEASSAADVPRAARKLAKRLSQTADEKAPTVRPYLRMGGEETELAITAIDTLDAVIEGLGLAVPGPPADEVLAEPRPTPEHGPGGAMAAFHQELAADLAFIGSRIQDCRAWIDDPDMHVADDPDIAGFDLQRLSDFERTVEFIRDHDWAWAIFDAPAAQGSDLDIAMQLYLETLKPVPRDLAQITSAVIEASRQTSARKRSFCVGPLGEGKRYRDALRASLALSNEITEALGLVVEPASPPAGTPQPTLGGSSTAVTTTPGEAAETPASDPFADR